MYGVAGRLVLVKRAGATLGGVRTKSISINGAAIDITTDDDAGIRKIMEVPGQLDIDITVSGILLGGSLRSTAMSTSDRVAAMEFIYPGFEGSPANTHGFTGDFYLESYTETGEYQGAVTFEATFKSAGIITLTS